MLSLIQAEDYIICADGGTLHALKLGLKPDLIIGDLDSLPQGDWKRLQRADIPIELFPQDKNETDLELALRSAQEKVPESILVVGALGGRLDQTLGNLSLMSDPGLSAVDVRADDGVEETFFCRRESSIDGNPGDIVSLLPWMGTVTGVRTEGLRWPLHSETLFPEKSRGISNKMLDRTASVSIESGLLLIVHRRQAWVLDISRIEAGRVTLSPQSIDLRAIAENVIVDIKRRSKEENKPMSVSLDVSRNLPHVSGDSERVRQIFDNLLDNAYHYTQENGTIEIHIHSAKGSEVQVDVMDNGVGIAQPDQERVFERFYRGEHPFVLATPGTGLGLPIVKQLVEMHKGRIWMSSEGILGHGSTFSFTLPVSKDKRGSDG